MLAVSYMEAAIASHSSQLMHHSTMGQMDLEGGAAQHPHTEDFQSSPWGGLAAFPSSQQHSPLQEFNSFNFMHNTRDASMSSMGGAIGRMDPPASAASASQQHENGTGEVQWPNMMSGRVDVNYAPHSTLSSSSPTRSPQRSLTGRSSQSTNQRKTLSDADRRRMCIYHDENPNVKQTEIGAMFGVERSTVSKVLRQKEKYLYPEEGTKSPVKRSKGKFPDIEKALSNWARNSQRQGIPVSDAMIKEKARFFATTVGSSESHMKLKDGSWLEKFKQKNNLSAMKVMKRSGKPSRQTDSTRQTPDAPTISRTSSGVSVHSPDRASPRALSIKRETSTKPSSPETFLSFDQSYQQPNNQSNPSLASPFDEIGNSFVTGPTSPSYFTPEQCAQGPFIHQPQARVSAASPYSRPRSQTFPVLGGDAGFISTPPSSEPLTPKFITSSQGTSFQSPSEEMPPPLNPMSAGNGIVHQASSSSPAPHHRHTNTSPAMLPPQITNTNLQHGHHSHHLHSMIQQDSHAQLHSPPDMPNSPTQEDACKALELVMQFINHQPMASVDQTEYIVMGKLMQRLRLRRHSIGSNLGQIAESGEVGAL